MSNKDYWDSVVATLDTSIIEASDDGLDFDPTMVSFSGGADHTVIDEVLSGRLGKAASVRALVQPEIDGTVRLPVKAGTRVAFVNTLESILTYANVPGPKCGGTVITLKTANGPSTSHDRNVYVKWDDGAFRAIRAEHLRLSKPLKTASNYRRVVADLGDLAMFFEASKNSGDELIHQATKDLWSIKKDGSNYVIERLFDDNGEPLKV